MKVARKKIVYSCFGVFLICNDSGNFSTQLFFSIVSLTWDLISLQILRFLLTLQLTVFRAKNLKLLLNAFRNLPVSISKVNRIKMPKTKKQESGSDSDSGPDDVS